MVDFEDIHPPGSAVVERPFQETGAEQQVERPRDFHEIVADVGSELLTAEDDARMPREEEEQVEVACVPQTSRFNELHGQGVGGLNLLDPGAPFRDAHERRLQGYRAETKHTAGLGLAQGFRLAGIDHALAPGRVPVSLSGLQILVIEDAPDVLDVLTMLLRVEGADVAGARSGHEALKLFRSRHFDVVMSDLGLPDISGDVLIRTLIAAARRPVKVVVITGESQPVLARALEAGAGAIFAKPCQWRTVVTYLDGLGLVPAA